MSNEPAVSPTEAARRAAWQEICMVEYRLTGDMVKATEFAERIEKTYRDNVLREAARVIRSHPDNDDAIGRGFYSVLGLGMAADMIDPDRH